MKAILKSSWTKAAQVLKGLGGERPLRRATSLVLLYVLLVQPVLGLRLRAETSGATAPEVTKFEPVDTTDLVNLASGDFTYNIPILNVPGPEGGYPLSLNYHSGLQHGEEASWVGLGWDLQPGSIARSVRGYPDDFYNERINKRFGSSSSYEYSIGVTFLNSGVGVGISYDTNKGYGGYVSYAGNNLGARASYWQDGSWSVGIGYTMDNGYGAEVTYGSSGSVGVEVGSGGKAGHVGVSANTDRGHTTYGVSAAMNGGVSLSWDSSGHTNIGVNAEHASASFSNYSGGGIQQDSITISIPVYAITIDLSYTEYWIDKTESELAYGYFNHHLQNASESRVNEWLMESDPKAIPGDDPKNSLGSGFNYSPSYDHYTVMGQGTGGNIRPTRLRDWVYHPKRVDDSWREAMAWPWMDANGFAQEGLRARFVFDGDNTEVLPANSLGLNRVGLTARGNDGRGGLLANLSSLDSPGTTTANQLLADIKALVPTSGDLSTNAFNGTVADPLYLGKAFRPQGGSRVVNPLLDTGDGHTFVGFDVWELDGKRYLYHEVVQNLWSENLASNAYDRSGDWFRSVATIRKPYAYAWYLSELRYPDYYDTKGDGLSDDDQGGWVKFTYSQAAQDYRWHTSPDAEFNDGPLNRVQEVGQKKAGMMYGMEYGAKQLKYPLSIETATHKAFFSTSPRMDAQEISFTPKIFDDHFYEFYQMGSPRRDLQKFQFQKTENGKIEIKTYDSSICCQTIYTGETFNNCAQNGVPQGLANMGIWIHDKHQPLPRPWKLVRPGNRRMGGDNPIKPWVNGWTYTSSYNAINGRNGLGDVYELDGKAYPDMAWISVNGIPVRVDKITLTWDDYLTSSGYSTELEHTFYCTFEIDPSSQFWNNSDTLKYSPSLFQDIRKQWSDMQISTSKTTNNYVSFKNLSMQKLDDIYLIEKSTNRLVKQIHFEYGYDLCQGTLNSTAPPTSSRTTTGGKLTLKSVQVFGEDGMGAGNGAKLPPYRFFYAHNPDYGSKYAYDRWGMHKSNGAMWQHRDAVAEDQDAWDLTRIQLPTGGNLYVQYEPKDYARVQDRRPQNAAANRGMVGHYEADLKGWLSKMGLSAWPATNTEWDAFITKTGTTPMQLFAPGGDTASDGSAVPKMATKLPHAFAPLDSAPVPRDLVRWWSRNQAFTTRQASAASAMSIAPPPASGTAKALMPPVAVGSAYKTMASDLLRNTRMVNLVFEYFTAGDPGTSTHRRLARPLDELNPDGMKDRTEEDRRTAQAFSVLALLTVDAATNRTNLTVIDPDFRWPRKAPDAAYVTWTHPCAKVGGGVRVKRLVASDDRRNYVTSYTYQDVVDGEWTTSGVAVVEPPPFSYSADDDRVIYPEFGGWGNERGGGIVHSRVSVRHSWNEDPTPAGIVNPATGTPVQTLGGESVFRFISPADLPHRMANAGYSSLDAGGKTRRVKVTEVFNMGAWWGQLLWREDRDAQGRTLQRVENRYTQLDGYLRYFPRATAADGAPTGTDVDQEYQYQKNYKLGTPSYALTRGDRSYDWAEKYSNAGDRPLPNLTDPATDSVAEQAFPKAAPGYLNASLNLTLAYRTDNAALSSVDLVRELNLKPLVSETRTYAEGAASKPTAIHRNTVWESRTGQVLETWTKGRTSPTGTPGSSDPTATHEWLISRTWPAYWAYPGMFKRDDSQAGYGMPMAGAEGFASGVVNMLSQTTQSTTSRRVPGSASETYLNSRIESWWQAPGGFSQRWLKGGNFVWNGSGALPPAFDGYPAKDNWTPASVVDAVGGYQPYKAKGWLFTGAVTRYDAYGHALEAVEGDGVFGCSKYGYNSTANFAGTLPGGLLPVAKFTNARDAETLYINFEDPTQLPDGTVIPRGDRIQVSDDPLVRLGTAYTGEAASSQSLTLKLPTSPAVSLFELRYFVKAASAAAAKATYPTAPEILGVTQVEGGWWLVRAKVAAGQTRTFGGGGSLIDDVAAFPWRRNGAPASVSHFGYDRALGLVTSITGANGRTTRYRFDKLGRLMTTYDAYGNPSASTRYYHMNK